MDYNSTVLPPFDDPHYDYGPMYLCGAVCLTEAYIPAWGVCLAEALYTCVGPSASLRPTYIPAWGVCLTEALYTCVGASASMRPIYLRGASASLRPT